MDGFAVRWEDFEEQEHAIGKPIALKVIEEVPAGKVATKTVAGSGDSHHHRRSMPQGALAVVKVEETEPSAGSVKMFKPIEPRAIFVRKGKMSKRANALSEKVRRFARQKRGCYRSLAKSFVLVYQQPRVAIISTGDELADFDERFSEEKIINSNSYGIAAAVQEAEAFRSCWGSR